MRKKIALYSAVILNLIILLINQLKHKSVFERGVQYLCLLILLALIIFELINIKKRGEKIKWKNLIIPIVLGILMYSYIKLFINF